MSLISANLRFIWNNIGAVRAKHFLLNNNIYWLSKVLSYNWLRLFLSNNCYYLKWIPAFAGMTALNAPFFSGSVAQIEYLAWRG